MTFDKEQLQNNSDKIPLKKSESEMDDIFNKLSKDANIGNAIEQIFKESDNLEEIQSKLILLLQKHSKELQSKVDVNIQKEKEFDDKKIAQNITEFMHNLIKNYENKHHDVEKGVKYDDKYSMDKNSKMNIKKLVKAFAVYEIYKVMNPRRIAGETKKDNFEHNMMMGGIKRASHYEGGKEADLKSYGEAEVHRIERVAKSFNKGGGISI